MRTNSVGFRVSGVALSILMFFVFSGLLPVAVVAYKKGTKFHSAEVQVQAPAEEVYSTALGIVYDDPAIELRKKDDKNMKVEGRRGKLTAKIEVKQLDGGKTDLKINADAGKKEADKELALYIAERICEVLGVEYEVVEE